MRMTSRGSRDVTANDGNDRLGEKSSGFLKCFVIGRYNFPISDAEQDALEILSCVDFLWLLLTRPICIRFSCVLFWVFFPPRF